MSAITWTALAVSGSAEPPLCGHSAHFRNNGDTLFKSSLKRHLLVCDVVLMDDILMLHLAGSAMQQHGRKTFGLRGTQPTLKAERIEARNWPRQLLPIFVLPIVGFLAFSWLRGNATFYYKVEISHPSTLTELLDQCSGKDRITPDVQISSCTELIQSGKGNQHGLADAFYNRGNAYAAKSDFDRAIADYDQAIRFNPNLGFAFDNRGRAYIEKNQIERAIADFDGAIRLKSDSAVALHNRCWARTITGDLSGALSDCDESLRVRPHDAGTLSTRGLVQLKAGNIDQAIADFDAALNSDPKMDGLELAAALYGRGLAKQKQGSPAASDDLAAAKSVNPGIAEQFFHYGIR